MTLTDPSDDLYTAKSVAGFPDYIICRSGAVYRKTFRNRHLIKTHNPPRRIAAPLKQGYPTVNLWRAGKMKTLWLHAVMLKAFVGPRPRGFVAAHNNGIRSDCRIENLAWKTPRQNYDDMFIHGTNPAGTRNPNHRLTDRDVENMRARRACGETVASLQKRFGVCRANVYRICSGERWPHLLRAHGVRVVFTKPHA